MALLFEDTVALVSGGGHGIGPAGAPAPLAVAQALLAAGCRVALTDTTLARARQAAQTCAQGPDRCLPLALDVRDAGQCQAAVDAVRAAWGPVGVLVNNAGIGGPSGIDDADLPQDPDPVLAGNAQGPL